MKVPQLLVFQEELTALAISRVEQQPLAYAESNLALTEARIHLAPLCRSRRTSMKYANSSDCANPMEQVESNRSAELRASLCEKPCLGTRRHWTCRPRSMDDLISDRGMQEQKPVR